LLPRAQAPPVALREALAPLLPPRAVVALSRGGRPGRWAALVVDERGSPRLVAKVATDEDGTEALEREADAISHITSLLQPPLATPRLLARGEGVLVFEYVDWRPRLRPWRLPPDVARALGAMQASTGMAHGDCTPWNLLATGEGWTLVDWEDSGPAGPFSDPLLYLLRSQGHLGRPSRRALVAGLRGSGWIGAALLAYAEAAGAELGDSGASLEALAQDDDDDPRTRQAMAAALEQ
jgi:hypothetical protein